MSAHTRKHPIKKPGVVCMHHAGHTYEFPKKVAEKYRMDKAVSADDVFEDLNEAYTKPGALLRGIRVREGLTQVGLAKMLKMTQSDISQMENGTRGIGRTVAKRIEKLFEVSYRSFLS
jgi:ribosome-binding protein aMBF1 (putative translation factor)